MNSPKLGIALLPDLPTMQYLIELQRRLNAIAPLQPLLGIETNLPHLTLLQGRFSDIKTLHRVLPQLQAYLQMLLQQHPTILNFEQLPYCYKPPGWYFLQPSPATVAHQAHQFCFAAPKSTMFLTPQDRQKDLTGYTASEILHYSHYGYRYIGSDVHPHFRLGQTLNRQPVALDDWLQATMAQPLEVSGAFEHISLYEVGVAGSHAASLLDLQI